MEDRAAGARFEAAALPRLDAAYNLARWLTRDDHAAEDVVREAYLRGLKCFGSFRGGDGRAWILAIVRNACFDWLKLRRAEDLHDPFDEDIHSPAIDRPAEQARSAAANPEALAARSATAERIGDALERLPAEYREALVLRELEGLSYKEIASIAEIPIGTVMSRLARTRRSSSSGPCYKPGRRVMQRPRICAARYCRVCGPRSEDGVGANGYLWDGFNSADPWPLRFC